MKHPICCKNPQRCRILGQNQVDPGLSVRERAIDIGNESITKEIFP